MEEFVVRWHGERLRRVLQILDEFDTPVELIEHASSSFTVVEYLEVMNGVRISGLLHLVCANKPSSTLNLLFVQAVGILVVTNVLRRMQRDRSRSERARALHVTDKVIGQSFLPHCVL